MSKLRTTLGDINLENPFILASGILGQTKDTMSSLLEQSMSGVVTKSIGKEPKKGHDNPTMVELEHGLINAMGLPNPGIDEYVKELEPLAERYDEKVIMGSLFSGSSEGFTELSLSMESAGVDAVELNLSCPHAGKYGSTIGKNPQLVKKIIKRVKNEVDIPIFAKLPPLLDITEPAIAAEDGGADGIVAINTLRAMTINVETREPILGNNFGGYSGPAVKPVGIRCVYEIYQETDIPIIGCGGINDGRDALEYIMAGASALQMGSSLYYRGKEAEKPIAKEMKDLMDKEDIGSIEDVIGVANR